MGQGMKSLAGFGAAPQAGLGGSPTSPCEPKTSPSGSEAIPDGSAPARQAREAKMGQGMKSLAGFGAAPQAGLGGSPTSPCEAKTSPSGSEAIPDGSAPAPSCARSEDGSRDEIPCGVWGSAPSRLGRQPNVLFSPPFQHESSNQKSRLSGLLVRQTAFWISCCF